LAFTSRKSPGLTYGGKQVTFDNSLVFSSNIAAEIGEHERQHVALLQGALGSLAISKPEINLGALGFGFSNQNDFLKLARTSKTLA
jgi:hypothetical protein